MENRGIKVKFEDFENGHFLRGSQFEEKLDRFLETLPVGEPVEVEDIANALEKDRVAMSLILILELLSDGRLEYKKDSGQVVRIV